MRKFLSLSVAAIALLTVSSVTAKAEMAVQFMQPPGAAPIAALSDSLGQQYVLAGQITTTGAAQLVVTANSAYSAGNCIGSLITLSNMTRTETASGTISNVVLSSRGAANPIVDIFFFSAAPTTSTVVDHGACAIAVGDMGNVLGVVHLTDWTTAGTGIGQSQLQIPFGVIGAKVNNNIYALIVARGTPTFTSTSDLFIRVTLTND